MLNFEKRFMFEKVKKWDIGVKNKLTIILPSLEHCMWIELQPVTPAVQKRRCNSKNEHPTVLPLHLDEPCSTYTRHTCIYSLNTHAYMSVCAFIYASLSLSLPLSRPSLSPKFAFSIHQDFRLNRLAVSNCEAWETFRIWESAYFHIFISITNPLISSDYLVFGWRVIVKILHRPEVSGWPIYLN